MGQFKKLAAHQVLGFDFCVRGVRWSPQRQPAQSSTWPWLACWRDTQSVMASSVQISLPLISQSDERRSWSPLLPPWA